MAACANCGYTGAPFGPDDAVPRPPLSTFAGARAKLATATQDLFRLSGNNSIPVEAEVMSAPPPAPAPQAAEDPTAGRKAEASLMFSLEALMKANASPAQSKQDDEAPEQLWTMQSGTPLFGTEYDQALLTTPLKPELTSMDSMTVPSRRPPVRRLLPLVLAVVGGAAALAGFGWWAFGPSESEASPNPEIAIAEPAPAPEPVAEATPVAGSEEEAPAPPPAENVPAAGTAPAAAEAAAAAESEQAAAAAQDDATEEAADDADDDAPKSTKKKKKTAARKRTTRARATAPSSAAKAPFNTSAARSALSAAASRAAACKGTSGTGKVQLTFATSGRVSSAQLVSGPFAGTAAGKCALRHFKAAKVPAFSGSPQSVAKSFKIP